MLNCVTSTIIEADRDNADAETWTEAELAELFQPKPPLTGKEIVEKHLLSGVIGSWSDEGRSSLQSDIIKGNGGDNAKQDNLSGECG